MSLPSRKRSFVWNHFDVVKGEGKKATCRICHKTLAYTAATMSNLNRHVRRAHPHLPTEETPIEMYTLHEVEDNDAGGSSELKTFEITMKNFGELDQDINQTKIESNGLNWTPESGGTWKPHTTEAVASPTMKKERNFSRRSEVWNHFRRSACKTQGQCIHCGKTIKSGTISNLARHLRQKHPSIPVIYQKTAVLPTKVSNEHFDNQDKQLMRNEADIYTEFIEVNVNDLENPINIIETRTTESQNIVSELPNLRYTDTSETITNQASQTEFLDESEDFDINDFIKPKKRAVVTEQVDRQLVKMIVKGCHPVSMVEHSTFKEFVSLLNPKYIIPTANKITLELIPECYQECEKKTTKSLRAAEGVCLYIDQWITKSNNYFCVTAHIINTECKFESVFLSCHILSLTQEASEISERLLETARDWEITDKIVAVVTNNSKVVATAVKLCGWPHIPHFMQTLSLVIYEGLQSVKAAVLKVRNLIDEITQKPELLAEVYSTHKSLSLGLGQVKLITKVKNDCSSSFMVVEMLTRFEKLKSAIVQVKKNHPEIQAKMSENEWRNLSSFVEVLSIFKSVKTEVVKEDRVCISKIMFYFRALKQEMEKIQNSNNYLSETTVLATTLCTSLNKHFEDIDKVDLFTNVLLLDPRLKKHIFHEESSYATACSILKKEVCEVVLSEPFYPESKTKSLWYSFDNEVRKLNAVKDPIGKGILELDNYLQEQLLSRNNDSLVWWNQRRAIYPRLFKLAKKYLCITCKSTHRESISYSSAHMISHLKYNDSISPNESEIMFLHHNM